MAPEDQSTLKRRADEITPDEITPDEQGGEKRGSSHTWSGQRVLSLLTIGRSAMITPPDLIEEKSRVIDIKIHFNNINIDVSFTWKIKENTTVRDLHKKINTKMQEAFAYTWDKVRVNDLVKAENSLREILKPGTLRRDLGLGPSTSKKNENTLNLHGYDLDCNLWALVEGKPQWRCQDLSTLRLDVVMPNRKELEKKLEVQEAANSSDQGPGGIDADMSG